MKKTQILGVIRHVLTFGGGFLVAKGTVDESTAAQLTAAIITVIGSLWSIFSPEK